MGAGDTDVRVTETEVCCRMGEVVVDAWTGGAECEGLDWLECKSAGGTRERPFLPRGVFSHQPESVGFCCARSEKSASMPSALAVTATEAVWAV